MKINGFINNIKEDTTHLQNQKLTDEKLFDSLGIVRP